MKAPELLPRNGPQLYGAIDLGGAKLRSLITNLDGRILARDPCMLLGEDRGPDSVVDKMLESLKASVGKLDSVRCNLSNLKGIGIAAPGTVDVETGIVHKVPQLPDWHEVSIVEKLADRFSEMGFMVDVYLQNDASAEALGERIFGSGRRRQHIVYLTIGTGIGGGIIIDNKLYWGRTGAAGEVGHMVIDANSPIECRCGHGHGHLECLASGTAIGERGKELLAEGRAPRLAELLEHNGGPVSARMVSQAADEGDADCCEVFAEVGRHLGVALASLVNIFNPDAVIVGGAVTQAARHFRDEAERTMQERVMHPPNRDVDFALGKLGADAAGRGMVAYVHWRCTGEWMGEPRAHLQAV